MTKMLISIAVMALATPAVASAALSPTLAKSGASSLQAGQWLWDEAGSGAGPLAIMVSIDRQHLYVYRGETLIGVSTVSTGKPGKATPLGEFRILQKNVFHRSNLYSNAPMPYMQRLTWGGIAIHGGQLPGYPASHGCIRVPLDFAKKLFAATDMGGIVSVSDGQSGPFLRVEVDMAALETNDDPAVASRSRAIQFAEAKPRKMVASERKALPAPAVHIALDEAALTQPPVAEIVTAAAEPPSRSHWLVPYYGETSSGVR